ncbi:MAG: VanZ family protein [Gemmatimonadaceae bacterium]
MTRWGPAAVVLMLIAGATLYPVPPLLTPLPMFCLACGDLGGVDVVLNVLLFLPFGAALVWAGGSWRRAVVGAVLVSLTIEFLQLAIIPGRDASVSDLLTNSLGGMLGATGMRQWRELVYPQPRGARWLALAGMSMAVAVMSATAALLRPSVPEMGLWGQWAPQQLHFEPFTGEVHAVRVNGFNVPYNLVPDYEALRQSVSRGPTRAEVEITTGRASQRLSAIARVGSNVQELLLFGQRGTDFVFRTRLATRDWNFRTPAFAIAGALAGEAEPMSLVGELSEAGWTLSVHSARGAVARFVPLSLSLGWSFILPFEHPLVEGDWWISTVWLVALALLPAYWGAMAGRRAGNRRLRPGPWWFASSGVVLGGLATIASVARFPMPAASEWLGVALGCVAGFGIAAAVVARAVGEGRAVGMEDDRRAQSRLPA